jgi:hypothetical protein
MQRDPLPDDDIELPSELALGEDEDMFLATIKPETWSDLGLHKFTATLPAASAATQEGKK